MPDTTIRGRDGTATQTIDDPAVSTEPFTLLRYWQRCAADLPAPPPLPLSLSRPGGTARLIVTFISQAERS